MPERTITSQSEYRYGFNGQEKSDELDPNGNLTTAMFWQYDSRTGRRWNVDPKTFVSISPYNCLGGNPIYYSDILGDVLKGATESSSNKMLETAKSTMSGDKFSTVRSLISIGDDKKTFKSIDKSKFTKAIEGLNDKEKAIAIGFFRLINEPEIHSFRFIDDKEKFNLTILKEAGWDKDSKTVNYFRNINSDGTPGSFKDGNFFKTEYGGGFNVETYGKDGAINGTYTLLSTTSNKGNGAFADFAKKKHGLNSISTVNEITLHEMFGHGLSMVHGINGKVLKSGPEPGLILNYENAIRAGNLFRQIKGNKLLRDGSRHNPTIMTAESAKSIPEYLTTY